jgi:hypothetical protein
MGGEKATHSGVDERSGGQHNSPHNETDGKGEPYMFELDAVEVSVLLTLISAVLLVIALGRKQPY